MTPRKILLPLAEDTTDLMCGKCRGIVDLIHEDRCRRYAIGLAPSSSGPIRTAACLSAEAEAAQMARDAEAWRRIRAVITDPNTDREKYIMQAVWAERLREEAP